MFFRIILFFLISSPVLSQQDTLTFTAFQSEVESHPDFEIINDEIWLNSPSLTSPTSIFKDVNLGNINEWKIAFDLDFSPSTSNQLIVYLVKNEQEQFYFTIGETGSGDGITFFHTSNSKDLLKHKIADSLFANGGDFNINIKQNLNKWSIEIGKQNYDFEYNFDFTGTSQCGFTCKYTSTRNQKFVIKEFEVISEEQTIITPLEIISSERISSHTFEIIFSKPLLSISNSNCIITGDTLLCNSPTGISKNYHLQTTIVDFDNNSSTFDTIINTPEPELGNIIITELNISPNDNSFLPNEEYIELYNRTNESINLLGWSLCDLNDCKVIETELFILPKEHIVFSKNVIPFENSFVLNTPSLNNSGDKISLFDPTKHLIHTIDYRLITNKIESGKSLSLQNYNSPCNHSTWGTSLAFEGGSPGQLNIQDKTESTSISLLETKSQNEIKIISQEQINPYSYNLSDFEISPKISLEKINVQNDTITIITKDKVEEGRVYTIQNILGKNCINEPLIINNEFVLSPPLEVNDLVFNEVLFSGFNEDILFLEIKNTSSKGFLAHDVKIGTVNNNQVKEVFYFNTPYIIHPNDYFVITNSKKEVVGNYIVEQDQLIFDNPDLDFDKNDSLAILNKDNQIIDIIATKDIYLDDDIKGASYERIESEITPTWFRSGANAYFGTPSYKNSQERSNSSDLIHFSSPLISPNNDGHQDDLQIEFNLDGNDYKGSCFVFGRFGNLKNTLFQNVTLSSNGIYKWYGLDSTSITLKSGVYILLFELYKKGKAMTTIKKLITIDSP